MSSFAPVSRARVADQVAEAVRQAILGGAYRPGDALPPERDLAEQFGVGRSSVREAVHRLEAWGLVEMRHGAGTHVTDFLTTAGLSLLPWLLAPAGRLDPGMLRDLLEIRAALLGFTASLAARRATPAQIEGLERALERVRAAETLSALQDADYAFYNGLVDAAGNRVLRLLATAIGRVYAANRETFAGIYAVPFDTTPHRGAIQAIRAGDADAAREAMQAYGDRAIDRSGKS